jgi:hypothetical protein
MRLFVKTGCRLPVWCFWLFSRTEMTMQMPRKGKDIVVPAGFDVVCRVNPGFLGTKTEAVKM